MDLAGCEAYYSLVVVGIYFQSMEDVPDRFHNLYRCLRKHRRSGLCLSGLSNLHTTMGFQLQTFEWVNCTLVAETTEKLNMQCDFGNDYLPS